MSESSERNRKVVARRLTWFTAGSAEGDLVGGWDGAEPFTRAFPLEDGSDAIDAAALHFETLSLRVALPIFVDGTKPTAASILRSHVAGCRFVDFEGAALAQLDRPPNRAVQLGRFTYGFWKLPEPIDGDELAALQRELRDTLGGDPSWSASPLELHPVAGIPYAIGDDEVEPVELKVRPS